MRRVRQDRACATRRPVVKKRARDAYGFTLQPKAV